AAPACLNAYHLKPLMTERVLILGGGFAGLTVAQGLRGKGFAITLVDQHNYHLFQPLLYQVATGELLGEAITTPLRHLLPSYGVSFRLGNVIEIDLLRCQVHMEDGDVLEYDFLFLALGTVTNFFGNKTISQHALDIKGLEGAETTRSRLILALERASQSKNAEDRREWLHFVVAGGGATGVEFCAALVELLQNLVPNEYPELDFREVQVSLVHGGEALLPGFANNLQKHAATKLRRLGINLLFGTHVKDYDGQTIICDSGPPISARTLIWTAGVAANPSLSSLTVPKGRGGRLLVDHHLRLLDFPEVFVVGDLAIFTGGDACPQVAPFAMQSARYAAKFLCAQSAHKPLIPPFGYHDPGIMTVLGRLDAVCQIPRWHLRWYGLSAWGLWLGLHLYRIIGTGNRLRTLLDWSNDYIRRRTSVQLLRQGRDD
ncbi:NAD(P)/FAD-dependent oxidoreductase, partial [Acidithiobacillus ferriphilus]